MTEPCAVPQVSRDTLEWNRSLLQHIPDQVLSIGPDGLIRYLNRAVGYRMEDVIGRSALEFVPDEWRPRLQAALDRVFVAGETDEFDLPAFRDDNKTVAWFACRAIPFRRDGRVEEALMIATDITVRKHAEQQLEQGRLELQERVRERTEELARANAELTSEVAERRKTQTELLEQQRFLNHVAEATPFVLYVFDVVERRNIYINRQITDQLGYSAELVQAMGDDIIARLIHPDDQAGIELHFARLGAAADGVADINDYRTLHADGTCRWFRSRDVVFARNPDGTVRRVLGTSHDITAERAAEEKLRSSEQRLRLMADALPVLIAYVGSDHRFRFNNALYQEWFGLETGDLSGRLVAEILGDEFETFRPFSEQALRGIQVSTDAPMKMPDGRIRDLHVVWVPDIDEHQTVNGYYVLVNDVTERRKQEEFVRRTERLASIGTLAAGVSHEINNPLAAIYNTASAALRLEAASENSHLREMLDLIRSESERIKRIVKSVQQFARDGVLERRPHLLKDVAQLALQRTQPAATERRVEIIGEFPDGLPPLPVDGVKLEGAIINLIANALEASPPASTVIVRIVEYPDRQELIIADQGHGISEADLTRIFDPFYSTREQEGGTGLGLSIAHGIVGHHGGHITVQSERGGGTTMTVSLPYLTIPIT